MKTFVQIVVVTKKESKSWHQNWREKEGTEMKIIKIEKRGSYTHHGIGYTEHDGYGGTSDNRMSIKLATAIELKSIKHGERYQLIVNGKNKGTFVK